MFQTLKLSFMMDFLICMTFNKGFDYNSYCWLKPINSRCSLLIPSKNIRKPSEKRKKCTLSFLKNVLKSHLLLTLLLQKLY